jgi:hypothetical protein
MHEHIGTVLPTEAHDERTRLCIVTLTDNLADGTTCGPRAHM